MHAFPLLSAQRMAPSLLNKIAVTELIKASPIPRLTPPIAPDTIAFILPAFPGQDIKGIGGNEMKHPFNGVIRVL